MPKLRNNGIIVSESFLQFLRSTQNITITFFFDVSGDGLLPITCNFLDIEDQKITYLDVTKYPDLTEEQAFSEEFRKKRIQISPSRIFGKIFKKNMIERHINNSDLEFFSNAIKSYFGPPLTLKVVTGQDIQKYYNHRSYASGNGTLNKSCMRYDENRDYFDIYKDNAKLLVGFDSDNKVAARALLWDHVEMVEGNKITIIKLMDRIYTCFDKDVIQLKKWATLNGYCFKTEQNHNYKNLITFVKDGVEVESKEVHLVVTIPNLYLYKRYPYMDTFSYGYDQTNLLSNSTYSADSKHLSRFKYYAPYNNFMNTNGWFGENIEFWEASPDSSHQVHKPRQIFNKDYSSYILWLNEKFGFNFEMPDDFTKNNIKSLTERTERVLAQRQNPAEVTTEVAAEVTTEVAAEVTTEVAADIDHIYNLDLESQRWFTPSGISPYLDYYLSETRTHTEQLES